VHGAVLVFDEIKTGFRSALGGYQSIAGVLPDLTAFAKAMANGYSIAALAGSDAVMGHLGAYSKKEATIDGTYNANPYSLAAANKTLDILESEDVITRLYDLGDRLRKGITEAIAEVGIEATVSGLGSEWTVYFRKEAPINFRQAMESDSETYAKYHRSLLSQGILEPAFTTGDRRLNASTTYEDIERTIDANRVALRAAAE
jgi:glutamate-1-semialdehyde 2,1-aminomutase